MATGNPTWYSILLDARKAATDDLLTTESLASRAGITKQMASGWISKFVRWGYMKIEGSKDGPTRWVRIYRITRWGKDYVPGKRLGKINKAMGR